MMVVLLRRVLEQTKAQPATGHPVLVCIDEFAALGRMKEVERAVASMAVAGVKLMFVVQSLSQLKAIYKDGWETVTVHGRSPFQSRNEPEAAARESRLTGDRISGSKQGRARAAVSRRTLTDIIFHGGDEGLWARSISTPATRSSTGSYLWIFDEEEEDGCGRCAKPRSLRFCKLLWARCLRPWERVYRACLTARRCKSSAQVWWRQRASEAQGR